MLILAHSALRAFIRMEPKAAHRPLHHATWRRKGWEYRRKVGSQRRENAAIVVAQAKAARGTSTMGNEPLALKGRTF